MRTTRSTSRAQAVSAQASEGKRKIEDEEPDPTKKRPRMAKPKIPASKEAKTVQLSTRTLNNDLAHKAQSMVPALLTFSFEQGKDHLISVDHRFRDLFGKMQCKPFEHLEMVHPFRALATSIIGQQISWFAARSVNHKFVRLFDQSIPEKIDDYAGHGKPTSFYPSPELVAKTDIATLRTAGLSQRKAEYVLDLAARFADGRLSTDKLINADDEELAKMLIEVRGIGRWTVDMFAIFSLRRPDILPVGDLGVQRGLAVWFLSLHSQKHNWGWTPHSQKKSTAASTKKEKHEDADALPVIEANNRSSLNALDSAPTPDVSSVPPVADECTADDLPSLPPAFTPSIKHTLKKPGVDEGSTLAPLPEGITVELLKSRLSGKNKVKGAILTPKEMEDLTEKWKPYRSLGVYYMWSIADVPS